MKFRAPAKINLALHVTGQRPDGYHLIESLVTFADAGDEISIEPSDRDTLTFSGPFGGPLAADFGTNLIIKALDAIRAAAKDRRCPPVAIHLEKNLPLASGIGGGSADAAAALRGLNEYWGLGLSQAELMRIGLPLGADVPMCVFGKPLIARGIGEIIEPVSLPELPMVLVNPGVGVSTPAIFKALVKKANGGLPVISPLAGEMSRSDRGGRLAPTHAPLSVETRELTAEVPSSGATRHLLPTRDVGRSKSGTLVDYLRTTRNDLEAPARAIQPVIGDVIAALEKSGALFARMSGSGATCFGIYADNTAAEAAKASIGKSHPDWWVA